MDIVRKKTSNPLKKLIWPASIICVLVIGFLLTKTVSGSGFTIKRNQLMIATVERGDLSIKVRGPGVLTPKNIRWISAISAGNAEQVFVKPGAQVKAGDILIQLSNPQLERSLEESRWELQAQRAETDSAIVEFESMILDQQTQVFNAKLDFESVAMRLKAETELFDKGAQAVSKLDYERTKLENQQQQQRWRMEQQRLDKMQENVKAKTKALRARLNKMQKSVQSMEEQVANLTVTASIDSVVQEVAIEAGQQVIAGTNLAKLAKQDELIAELQIPELMIRDVEIGQQVIVDTRNNHIQGSVTRIAPAVQGGTVQVDVELTEPLPRDARPDLSIDAQILVANLSDTLYVRRPTFAQSQSQVNMFKLDVQGENAFRTNVQLGRGSVQKIEVLAGLQQGDRVIISQNHELQNFQQVAID